MNTSEQTAIIEKVRKLMALAERAGTEAEAENAMARIQEILTKYNLSMDAVTAPGEETFVQEHQEFEWNQTWIRETYRGIARLYFCHMYFVQNGLKNQCITLVGKPVNIQTARYVADVVIATGKRLAKAYAQDAYREFGMNSVSASNNFKKGYAIRIGQRCNEMVRDAQAGAVKDSTTGTALVVGDFYKRELAAIHDFEQKSLGLRFKNGSGMKMGDHGHMSAGAEAANSVNLRVAGVSQSNHLYIGKGQS